MGTLTGITALALNFFLRERFGEDKCGDVAFRRLVESSGLSAQDVHLPGRDLSSVYFESSYMKLIQALLDEDGGSSVPQLFFEFGHYFFSWLSLRAGYAQSMKRIAGTLVDYTKSLNRFLDQMYTALGNPMSTIPAIHVTEVATDYFVAHIATDAPVRSMFLQGIIDNIATEVFGLQVKFEQLPHPPVGLDEGRWTAVRITSQAPMNLPISFCQQFPPQSGQPLAGLNPETFYRLFPFHLMLDMDLQVMQTGSLLQRLIPQLSTKGVRASDVLTIQSPYVDWHMSHITPLLENDKQKLVLRGPGDVMLQGGLYKVPFMHRDAQGALCEGGDALLFLLSLHATDLSEHVHDLYLCDFPAHDVTPDLILNETMLILDLEEERLHNTALKETLAETLAAHANGATGGATFNSDSAAHLTIKLLDLLIMGEDVGIQDVLQARDGLLRAGTNVWKPLHLDANTMDRDEEVSKSLGEMLGASLEGAPHAPAGPGAFEVSAAHRSSVSRRPSHVHIETQLSGRRQGRPTVDGMLSILKHSGNGTDTHSPSSTDQNGARSPTVRLPKEEPLHELGDDAASTLPLRRRNPCATRSVSLHRAGTGPCEGEGLRTRRSSVTMYEPIMTTCQRMPEPPTPDSHGNESHTHRSSPQTSPSASMSPCRSETSPTSPLGGVLPALPPTISSIAFPSAVSAPQEMIQGMDPGSHTCMGLPKLGRHRDQDDSSLGSRRYSNGPVPVQSPNIALAPFLTCAVQAPKPVRISALSMPSLMPKRSPTPKATAEWAREEVDRSPKGAMLAHKHAFVSSHSYSNLQQMQHSSPEPMQQPRLLLPSMPAPAAGTYHAEVLLQLTTEPSDQLASVLSSIDAWQFDSFELDRASNGRPLSCLAFCLMKKMDLTSKLNLDERRLARWLMRIEDGYPNNPYHCRIHAADVLRSFHCCLVRGGVLDAVLAAAKASDSSTSTSQLASLPEDGANVSAIRLLSCYLSAAIHDFDHRGVTNDFLIRSSDPLALLYNDISPLENHHVSASFLLMRDSQFAFFPQASKRMQDMVRKEVIDLVLATDMKQHFALIGVFNSKVVQGHEHALAALQQKALAAQQQHTELERNTSVRLNADGSPTALNRVTSIWAEREHVGRASSLRDMSRIASLRGHQQSSPTRQPQVVPEVAWDHETQMLALKMVLKCADLGHLSSSQQVHLLWVARLEEELFRQGDQEKALGQPVSPLMDRNKAGVTKSQCGFFNVVALPLFKSIAQVFPGCGELHANVESNGLYWKEVEAKHPAK